MGYCMEKIGGYFTRAQWGHISEGLSALISDYETPGDPFTEEKLTHKLVIDLIERERHREALRQLSGE